jgi:hypothetical protein
VHGAEPTTFVRGSTFLEGGDIAPRSRSNAVGASRTGASRTGASRTGGTVVGGSALDGHGASLAPARHR